MLKRFLWIGLLASGPAFAPPNRLNLSDDRPATLAWLEPDTLINTPAKVHAGSPRLTEGSGMGTGNLLLSFPLRTLGVAIYYNSVASVRQLGLGRGMSLSVDRIIYQKPNSTNEASLVVGDGTNFELKVIGGKWRPMLLQELNSRFVRTTDTFEETTDDGLTLVYGRLVTNVFGLQTIRDLFNNEISIVRNAQHQIESIRYPFSRTISLNYSNGLVTSIVGSAGEVYRLIFDSSDRLLNIVDPNGTQWELSYEPQSTLISQLKSPEGTVAKYEYFIGGILRTMLVGGYLTEYSYTPSSVTKREGSVVTKETFSSERIIKQESNGLNSYYEWTSSGLLSKFKRHGGEETCYTYSGSNPFPAKVVYPIGTQTTCPSNPTLKSEHTYNSTYKLISSTNTDGSVVLVTTYDPVIGRALTSSVNGRVTTYTYDRGKLTRVTSPSGAVEYSAQLDSYGNVTSETDASNQTTIYSYSNGLIDRVTDPAGRTTTYVRDGLGNVIATTNDLASSTHEYNAFGEQVGMSRVILSNGSTMSRVSSELHGTNGDPVSERIRLLVRDQELLRTDVTYDQSFPGRINGATETGSKGDVSDLLRD